MKNMMSIIFILLFIATPVIAQTTSNVEDVEEVVVVGTLASLISAIEKQRKSNSIVSVVDSDALGDFPDTDGISAINFNLNNDFKRGLFVAQDGTNDGKLKVKRQNLIVKQSELGLTVIGF